MQYYLGIWDTDCPRVYIAHVSSFQSRVRKSIISMLAYTPLQIASILTCTCTYFTSLNASSIYFIILINYVPVMVASLQGVIPCYFMLKTVMIFYFLESALNPSYILTFKISVAAMRKKTLTGR